MQLTAEQRAQATQLITDHMNSVQVWETTEQYNALDRYSDRIGQAWEQWPSHETRIYWTDSKKRDEYPTNTFVDEYLLNEDDESLADIVDAFEITDPLEWKWLEDEEPRQKENGKWEATFTTNRSLVSNEDEDMIREFLEVSGDTPPLEVTQHDTALGRFVYTITECN